MGEHNEGCRKCVECAPDQPHHWMPVFDEEGDDPLPQLGCKHCDHTEWWDPDDPRTEGIV